MESYFINYKFSDAKTAYLPPFALGGASSEMVT